MKENKKEPAAWPTWPTQGAVRASHSPEIIILPGQVCSPRSMAFEHAQMTAACPAGALIQLPVCDAWHLSTP